ncbi:hypothetical protein AXE44_RS01550 [Acinetobacter baumannii]|nr:hypothetical protein [Acinetobacter baumannii]
MKLNALLCSAVLATSMVTVAHADNTTHVAAASALGNKISKDRDADHSSKYWKKKHRHHRH